MLFLGAALTDWFDGYLARLWKQESRFGAMLDPIADKAMVIIALLVLTGYSGMNPWLILPATAILFREVFVSGLREYLGNASRDAGGDEAGEVEDHGADGRDRGPLRRDGAGVHPRGGAGAQPRADRRDDRRLGLDEDLNLLRSPMGGELVWSLGLMLIWFAAALTLVTGWDYLRKSLPHLKDER
jgi:phosphatidylglycerophosphate synthase